MNLLKEDATLVLNAAIGTSGLKKTWIADRTGINYNYLVSVLKGDRRLTTENAMKIAKVIGLDYQKILK